MKQCFFMIVLLFATGLYASNVANPVAPIPNARIAIGLSYHLGGYTITNHELASLLNRVDAQLSYAPVQYFNFGANVGVTQMEVSADSVFNYSVFHGTFAFSWGIHAKLSTQFIKDIVGLVAIGHMSHFNSKNSNNAYYGGYDANGSGGVIFHIPNFGYVAFGPQLYYIAKGENGSADGTTGTYSNINNLRGWMAIDYFPKMKGNKKYLPYISIEGSISPEVAFNNVAPIEEFSISLSFGIITKRLYGEVSSLDWHP